MRYTIGKQFEFSASHELTSLHGCYLPDGREHPCARVHGHNYVVSVELASDALDEHGMVLDYNLLAPFKDYLDKFIDHHHLNEVLPHIEPTAENLARFFYEFIEKLWPKLDVQITVSETPKTWATIKTVVTTVASYVPKEYPTLGRPMP